MRPLQTNYLTVPTNPMILVPPLVPERQWLAKPRSRFLPGDLFWSPFLHGTREYMRCLAKY